MNASIAIQVLPDVLDDKETVRIVDEVIAYIESTGLKFFVSPFETTVEGDYDKLMEIVKQCQLIAVKAGAPSVKSYVKIFFNPDNEILTINSKIDKYIDRNCEELNK
ncbi:MAG: thiamine-binding protein [Lachnospiraceae bacterium]|nr:thiamine-binding protein [Lachnospiraceae bacterium]